MAGARIAWPNQIAYTVQISIASASEVSGSRTGVYSCEMTPVKPKSAMAFATTSIIQFLRLINFMPPRISAGVEVRQILEVVANGSHDIAFHNLQMIDVIQKLLRAAN